MEEQNLPLELSNEGLKDAALKYIAVLERALLLLPSVGGELLAGTAGTVYLKQKGHRALSEEDSENIIRKLGTDDDKDALIQFNQARHFLSSRLKKNKWIGLITEQSGVPYLKIRRRIAQPSLWKAEEMVKVAEVLQRLQV